MVVESLSDLPTDILVEILSSLPLKTLLACRCSCKTFQDLISKTPGFKVNQILMLQYPDGIDNRPRRLHFIEPEFDLVPLALEGSVRPNRFFPLPQSVSCSGTRFRFILGNSCNGLLHWFGPDRAPTDYCCVVGNPITNEYVVIPIGYTNIERVGKARPMTTWLGFCPSTNQYKLLKVSLDHHGVKTKVLAIGSNNNRPWSWMDIKGECAGIVLNWFKFSPWRLTHALLDDGRVIYWYGSRVDHSRNVIIYFDFEKESFGVILLPLDINIPINIRAKDIIEMGVLDGCLCITYVNKYGRTHNRVHIWVRQEYDRSNEGSYSWIKQFVVDIPRPHTATGLRPQRLLRNGEIVMFSGSNNIVCYDPRNGNMRMLKKRDVGRTYCKVVAEPPSPPLVPVAHRIFNGASADSSLVDPPSNPNRRSSNLRLCNSHYCEGNGFTFSPTFIPLKDILMVDENIVKHFR